MAQIMAKRHRVGMKVKVRNVHGGYSLPPGLPEGVDVWVVAKAAGITTVRWDRRLWSIPAACIDAGYVVLPTGDPAKLRRNQ